MPQYTVREQICSEMSHPEMFDGMTDEQMLADLEANLYASHYDEVLQDWVNRLKADILSRAVEQAVLT